tara:strand:+ start:368 stop:1930 length:1563 start_codon:yes stop_codon:yes gene_type:complete
MSYNRSEEELLLQEFNKCKDDPIHFICTYIKVTHPVRGLVPFELYPFQKQILKDITKHRFNILRKFRQAGCTTISAAYSLWMATFQQHKSIVILSVGDTESTEVLDRIKIMYEELPPFLQAGIIESNKHTLKLKTNSIIKSRPSGKQSGRSLAGSFLVIDEAAFIENIDSIWAAVYPIISTGGRAFILSTVNGVGNWYYETYNAARAERNSFNAIDITWKQHPEYSRVEGYDHLYESMEKRSPPTYIDEWESVTRSNMPLKKWLQEYECEFLGTGDTFIEGSILTALKDNVSDDFYTKYNNRMRVWEDPDPSYEYIIGVDTALGRELDYSAFQVVNAYNGEIVAEFYSNKTPINEFSKILATEGVNYNTALVIVERNTIGNNVLDWLYNQYEYENVWHDEKGNPGFQVTLKNRDQILADLEQAIRTNVVKINSERTLKELNAFILTESGKVAADKNSHDDLIMSLALAIHGLNIYVEHSHVDFQRETSVRKDPLFPSSGKSMFKTAFNGMTEEDIKWLIS